MKQIIANEEITAPLVRLVHNDVNEVMETNKALEYAYSFDLDLVQISDQDVPVVKVLDINKHKYALQQEQKLNNKKQRTTAIQVKEVQFSSETDTNDLNVKLKSTKKFISSGKHVKLVMQIKGRLSSNKELINSSINKMNSFVSNINDVDFVQAIQVQGTNVICTIKSTI